MKITPDQRALFHVWCRQISEALHNGGVNVSEKLTKELIKMMLGNTREVLSYKVAQSINDYVRSDADLSVQHLKHGFISMDGLLLSMQAYGSTDLNIELVSTNEEKV